MPNLDNAKKALRQSKKHQARNRQYKNRIKKLYRQILDLSHDGKTKEATKLLPTYYKAIDKAAKKNILHKNTAARKKSFAAKLSAEKTVKDEKPTPKKKKVVQKTSQVEKTTKTTNNSETPSLVETTEEKNKNKIKSFFKRR